MLISYNKISQTHGRVNRDLIMNLQRLRKWVGVGLNRSYLSEIIDYVYIVVIFNNGKLALVIILDIEIAQRGSV
jgi:hypothetical protein